MKKIFIVNTKRFPTEHKTEGGHDNVMTCTRWTFSNGVSVSIMRCIFRYSATNESKVISITPIGGFSESYLEVSQALRAARKAALQTFGYNWDINIEL